MRARHDIQPALDRIPEFAGSEELQQKTILSCAVVGFGERYCEFPCLADLPISGRQCTEEKGADLGYYSRRYSGFLGCLTVGLRGGTRAM